MNLTLAGEIKKTTSSEDIGNFKCFKLHLNNVYFLSSKKRSLKSNISEQRDRADGRVECSPKIRKKNYKGAKEEDLNTSQASDHNQTSPNLGGITKKNHHNFFKRPKKKIKSSGLYCKERRVWNCDKLRAQSQTFITPYLLFVNVWYRSKKMFGQLKKTFLNITDNQIAYVSAVCSDY